MNNIDEIKIELDSLYKIYKKNKCDLKVAEKKKVGDLIFQLLIKFDNTAEATEQLSRFSNDICQSVFSKIVSYKTSVQKVDEIIICLLKHDKDKSKSSYYIKKYSKIIVELLDANNSYQDSESLRRLIVNVYKNSTTNKQLHALCDLVKKTHGKIYDLDYSNIQNSELYSIYTQTQLILNDINDDDIKKRISNWANLNGYNLTKDNTTKINSNTTKSDVDEIHKNSLKTEPVKETDKTIENDSDKDLASLIKREEQTTRKEITKELNNIKCSVDLFRSELNKSIEISATNQRLHDQIEKLESEIETVKQQNYRQKAEIEELLKENSELVKEKEELDSQLKNALNLNNRETSLEADRLKHDISKAVKFSYENWSEYENEEYNEDNYESLKVILKGIFRSLEKSGIDFKGIDT